MHILDVDLERPEIRRRKSSGKLHLRPENGRVVDPAMQHLRLRVAADVQGFGKEISIRDRGLFHFAPLHLSVEPRHFLHCFKFVLVRNPEYGTDQALFLSPGRSDIGDSFVAPLQPIGQHAGDH